MNAALFAPDFQTTPYWWERVPRPDLGQADLPARCDVLVIGSGYTGLNAALETARGGRHTVMIDAEDAGFGCSTRNGGQIGTSIKPDLATLAARHGHERAAAIRDVGKAALAWLEDFVRAEEIDCDFRVAGRFHAAHSARQYHRLERRMAEEPGLGEDAELVPRAEQHRELGSDAYHGGVLYPHHAGLDPARFHQGLLERVLTAGASVLPRCAAHGMERDGADWRVRTSRGESRAREVVVATNGYTGAATPWLRRRVIPIGSYMIATEPLAPEVMDRLMPRDRIVSDTRRVVYYYRASPDRRRILFGGRVAHAETDARLSAPRLHAKLCAIFPELAATRVSHSWLGFVAYTFDTLAHSGRHDGLHYAMGYCGSGVSMASYLGMRLGQQLIGKREGDTPFEGLPFPSRPLYWGWPWFLGPAVACYRLLDRLG